MKSQILALMLPTFVALLVSAAGQEQASPKPATVTILFTGGTEGHIEMCGCERAQAGGMGLRAAAVRRIEAEVGRENLLLLDAGRICSGADALDKERTRAYLDLMALLNYDAVNFSTTDLLYGHGFFESVTADRRLAWIASNLRSPLRDLKREVVLSKAGKRIGIVGLAEGRIAEKRWQLQPPIETAKSPLAELEEKVDLTIVLSDLSHDANRQLCMNGQGGDILISALEGRTVEDIGDTTVFRCPSKGRSIGRITVTWKPGETRPGIDGSQIPLEEPQNPLNEDTETRLRISQFYMNVAKNDTTTTSPLFADLAPESDKNNGYAGFTKCRDCHAEIYDQWLTTPHASSLDSLFAQQRQFFPQCVKCHVTGYADERAMPHLDPFSLHNSVTCEACHGPGSNHAAKPELPGLIRREVKPSLCMRCHTPERDPAFTPAKFESIRHAEPDKSETPDELP